MLAFPDTDELEVHLVLDGKRTIGRAPASRGIDGAVEATIDAVRDLGTGIQPRLRWARALDDADVGDGDQEVVAVALDGVDTRSPVHYGTGGGHEPHRRRRPRHARRAEPPAQPRRADARHRSPRERARYHRMPLPS